MNFITERVTRLFNIFRRPNPYRSSIIPFARLPTETYERDVLAQIDAHRHKIIDLSNSLILDVSAGVDLDRNHLPSTQPRVLNPWIVKSTMTASQIIAQLMEINMLLDPAMRQAVKEAQETHVKSIMEDSQKIQERRIELKLEDMARRKELKRQNEQQLSGVPKETDTPPKSEETAVSKIIPKADCESGFTNKFTRVFSPEDDVPAEYPRGFGCLSFLEPKVVTSMLPEKTREALLLQVKNQCVLMSNYENEIMKLDKCKNRAKFFVCHSKDFWDQPFQSDKARTVLTDGRDLHHMTIVTDRLVDHDCFEYAKLFNQVVSGAVQVDRQGNAFITGDKISDIICRVREHWRYYHVPFVYYKAPKTWTETFTFWRSCDDKRC